MSATDKPPVPLNEDERMFKAAYESGGKDFVDKPMSFETYLNLLNSGILTKTPHSSLYWEKSVNGMGVTVEDVEKIDVVAHPRYSYPVIHNHSSLEIVCVLTGECTNFIERTSLRMKAGDICILSPSAFHAVSVASDESRILNILVSCRFLEQSFRELLRGGKILSAFIDDILQGKSVSPYILYETGSDIFVRELEEKLCRESSGREYGWLHALSYLTGELLLRLIRQYELSAIVAASKGASSNERNERIVSILGYIGANYNRVSLADTAAAFGYSPSYLSRMIHEYTGKSFSKLVTEEQMNRAAQLLEEGELGIPEIASEIGCFDHSHFSKKFKRIFGMTPKQYKEAHKKG